MLNRLFDRILLSLASVAAAVLVFTTLSVDFEVIMRYGFTRPTSWVVAFSEYALLYILFLGTAWVLSEDGHVKVDILLRLLSPRNQRVLNIFTAIAGAVACAIFFWYGASQTWGVFQAGDVLWRSIIIPKWPIWMIMPFGGLLLTIQFIRRAWFYARGQLPTKVEEQHQH